MKSSSKRKLNALIVEYGYQKQQLKELKDSVDKLNDGIKKIMVEEDVSEYEYDGWSVTYKNVERTKVDEEMLIDIIKHLGIKGVIKKREYVDGDALESLIYKGKITEEQISAMDKANIVTEVPTLWVKGGK